MAVTIFVCGVMFAVPAGAGAVGYELPLRMVAAVNEVRAQHGLPALSASASLQRSARRYARWMLRNDYFGHLGQIRASSRYSMLGENLSWHSGGRPRVARTVGSWMDSPPHRALILHPGFRWVGAGPARGTLGARRVTAWVLHFGGPVLGVQPPNVPRIPLASAATASTSSPAGSSAASAAP
jgi:Cysteine-rich secretory protein family